MIKNFMKDPLSRSNLPLTIIKFAVTGVSIVVSIFTIKEIGVSEVNNTIYNGVDEEHYVKGNLKGKLVYAIDHSKFNMLYNMLKEMSNESSNDEESLSDEES